MRLPAAVLALALVAFSSVLTVFAQNKREAPLTSPVERAALHNGPDWAVIAPHLPNPDTATAEKLETAADVLRARRFPEDALDYYGYAMARGGNVSTLLNKMGVIRLELRQIDLAREMFRRTVRAQKKNPVAWNNLGVTEYSVGNYRAAIDDYRKATKFDKHSPVYHSNLGMAYFEMKDMSSARQEFAKAIKLDPGFLHRSGSGGSTIHALGTHNYGELCFEMARLFARENKPQQTMEWLSKATEAGFDVQPAMRSEPALAALIKLPEVQIMLANAQQLRAGRTVAKIAAPSLGPAQPEGPPRTNKAD